MKKTIKSEDQTYYIYILQNTINNKIYVGQTNNPAKRLREHKAKDRLNRVTRLYSAIKHYGFENFKFMILEEHKTIEEVDEAEVFYIQLYQTLNKEFGYNMCYGGRVNRNQIFSTETRKKMSDSKKKYLSIPENKIKMIERQKKFFSIKENKMKYSGENGSGAMFTSEQIKIIRAEYLENPLEYGIKGKLAKKYNISASPMARILNNKTYIDDNYHPELSFSNKIIKNIRLDYSNYYSISVLKKKYKIPHRVIVSIVYNKIYIDNNYHLDVTRRELPKDLIIKIRDEFLTSTKNDKLITNLSKKYNLTFSRINCIVKNKRYVDSDYQKKLNSK